MSDELELRPCVAAFAQAMEEKLRENDWKGGWHGDTPHALLERLVEEMDELEDIVLRRWNDRRSSKRIRREAADVANFAMMIADVCGALPLPTDGGVPETSSQPKSGPTRDAQKAQGAKGND